MLLQFIVYTTDGVYCVEDDSMDGAKNQVLDNMIDQETDRIVAVKLVNVYGYPY